MPDEFFDADGHPVNAVHGYTRFLCELLERAQPEHIAVAFDASLTSSFRNAIYPAYKANRELPPPDLERQFVQCRAITEALGVHMMIDHNYEADDLIGSTVWSLRALGWRSVIVSADKDFGQLLGEHDEQWDYARGLRWGPAGVHEQLGVHPHQVADYLALVRRRGGQHPRRARHRRQDRRRPAQPFRQPGQPCSSASTKWRSCACAAPASCAVKLREHAEQARLCRRLTRIALDAPGASRVETLQRQHRPTDQLDALCEQLRFGAFTRSRLHALLR